MFQTAKNVANAALIVGALGSACAGWVWMYQEMKAAANDVIDDWERELAQEA